MESKSEFGLPIGEFWLPSSPDVRIPGVLKRRGRGARLSLLGHLGENPEVILGSIEGIGSATLLQCHAVSLPINGLESVEAFDYRAKYEALYLFSGDYLADGWDSYYQAVSIEIPEIDLWAETWKPRLFDSNEPEVLRVSTLAEASTEQFVCKVESIILPSAMSAGDRTETLQRISRFTFEFVERRTVSFLFDLAHSVRDVVTIFLGRTAEITRLTFVNPLEFTELGYAISHDAELSMDSEFETAYWAIGFDQPLIPLSLMKHRLGDVILDWLDLREAISMQTWLYLSGTHGLRAFSQYSEVKLLALIQGLESLHRTLYDRTALDQFEWSHRIDQILSSLPDELRPWTKSKLQFSNQLSLSNRLDDLITRVGPVANTILQNSSQFKRKIVHSRNFLSHYDEATTSHRLQHHEIHAGILICSMLFDALILIELGFPMDLIDRQLLDTRKYKDLLFQREHYGIRF